jgi:hypothetical protein
MTYYIYLDGGVRVGKEVCVSQRRDGCMDGLQNSCLCIAKVLAYCVFDANLPCS